MKTDKKVEIICRAAYEKKADEIVILDIGQKTTLCDQFIVMSAPSQVRVRTIVDAIEEALNKKDFLVRHKEGYKDALWVLLDCAGIVVHVFYQDMRKFYDLENLWGDAPRTKYTKLST